VHILIGYRALIEYENFDDPATELAWIPFCSDVPQQLGFSDRTNKLLRPSPGKKISKFSQVVSFNEAYGTI